MRKNSLLLVAKFGQENGGSRQVLNSDIQTLRNPELCENYMQEKESKQTNTILDLKTRGQFDLDEEKVCSSVQQGRESGQK